MLSFFKKNQSATSEVNFSVLGTDLHSHLIPGIDDGAQNLNDSVELVKILLSLGFRKIITTPHIMADRYQNTPEIINLGLSDLKKALAEQNIDIEIEAAAEYYLDDDFEDKLESGNILTIANKYILFELSFSIPPINFFEIIERIIAKGYTPLLAHPERYTYLHGSIKNYHQIKDTGCCLQLNTLSLTGYYGKPVQKIAEKLIDTKLIDFVGSDMHHLKHAEALKLSLNQKYVSKILSDYPLQNNLL